MSEPRKVYRAHFGTSVNDRDGYSTWCHYGHVSPCGEWVDGNNVRWPYTSDWCDSEVEAKSRLAPKIAAIGARLLQQAAQLLNQEPIEC